MTFDEFFEEAERIGMTGEDLRLALESSRSPSGYVSVRKELVDRIVDFAMRPGIYGEKTMEAAASNIVRIDKKKINELLGAAFELAKEI